MDNDEDTGVPPDIPTVEFSASRPPTLMQRLTQESHNERLAQQEEMKSDKGTDVAYNRHLKRYETWWDLEQIRRINELEDTIQPPLIPEPAHPITVTKVSLFMKYETTRMKVQDVFYSF